MNVELSAIPVFGVMVHVPPHGGTPIRHEKDALPRTPEGDVHDKETLYSAPGDRIEEAAGEFRNSESVEDCHRVETNSESEYGGLL